MDENSMITYRYMTKADVEQVEDMIFDFCNEAEIENIVYEGMIDRIMSGETRVIVAENGTICGMAGYIISGPQFTGEFLYVKPEKRGTIIGGKLYGLAIEDGREEKVNNFVVFASRGKASIYKKLGYEELCTVLRKREV